MNPKAFQGLQKHKGKSSRVRGSLSILKTRSAFLLHVTLLVTFCASGADERLWLEAKVNGRNARLIFDTGTSYLVLFPKGATRLGLKFTNAPPDARVAPGNIPVGETEECELTIGENSVRTKFGIFDIPSVLNLEFDGLIGWWTLHDNIIEIDARLGAVYSLSNTAVIPSTWNQFTLRTNFDVLVLETTNRDASAAAFLVDTGMSDGVELSPAEWREWKATHKEQRLTLRAHYTPQVGLVVSEEGWAKKLSLGPLVLTDVPTTEAKRAADAPSYTATLGLAALKRLDFIVDGKHGIAYLHPTTAPFKGYIHNRLGAVFAPSDLRSDDLIAHVAEGSPAERAGIRNGDVLLAIGRLDVTKWRSDPTVLPLSRFWEQPAGTKLELTLRRGTEALKIKPKLRQILPP
jgi:hypothetical protein